MNKQEKSFYNKTWCQANMKRKETSKQNGEEAFLCFSLKHEKEKGKKSENEMYLMTIEMFFKILSLKFSTFIQ